MYKQYVYPLRFSCCVMCVSTQQALVGELGTLFNYSPKVLLKFVVYSSYSPTYIPH